MAEPYLERLLKIVADLDPLKISKMSLECKHFFSGAALYANGKICASLSPTGLALKLPEGLRFGLIKDGLAGEFRFFPKGPIKREYVALSKVVIEDKQAFRELLMTCITYTLDL
ncbi:MAG: TfoX/Sxy family protein [Anaerolineae bacterium]|nr:TfoX/Sxy family protein [Anaerolineae bacterium]